MKTYQRVLTIAGSDSGGGAGVQADIKTISACGCYAASAITAITVQNTLGVQEVVPVPCSAIQGQIQAVLTDIGADAIKIGMLHSQAVVQCVAQTLHQYAIRHIVLDPVMVSTSGHQLMEQSAIQSLLQDLLPQVEIITPNIPEANILLEACRLPNRIQSVSDMPPAAQALGQHLGVSVLLKAGHLSGEQAIDICYDYPQGQTIELPSIRINTLNTHGTGCTLSSALASYLALGHTLQEAAQDAKQYINNAIRVGATYKIGHGFGPVAHFYAYWKKE